LSYNPTHWYYTSGDVAVTYNSNTYTPALIKRGSVTYNDKLEVTELKLTIGYVENPTLEYIAINPVEILWISVMKLHRDQSPLEADVVFIGQIKNVKFKGIVAEVECVGFEHYLKMPIPVLRYQIGCNWTVFDSNCKLNEASYKVTATVTLDSTGTVLTSTTFGSYADGWFTGGKCVFGTIPRAIAAHIGNTITLAFKIQTLQDNDSVDVYPGCDGIIETCRDKFNNITHFLGFPFIPIENPAIRTS